MSHHIVTVCVVCVLCAAHVPCSAHTTTNISSTTSGPTSPGNPPSDGTRGKPLWAALERRKEAAYATKDRQQHDDDDDDESRNPSHLDLDSNNKRDALIFRNGRYAGSNNSARMIARPHEEDRTYAKRRIAENFKGGGGNVAGDAPANTRRHTAKIMEQLAQTSPSSYDARSARSRYSRAASKSRSKRDAAVDEGYFMKKLFEAYGDGTSITMEGFEKLVRKLGLLKLLTNASAPADDGGANKASSNSFQNKGLHDAEIERKNSKERCLNSRELFNTVAQDTSYPPVDNGTTTLPGWLFERVCPVLVYQLAAESSTERNGCIRVPENYNPVVIDKFYTAEDTARNTVQVWLYSTISIVIISLSGLLGVAVIPVMGKTYYNQVLQFLVALAVGTLAGDALIHLLPHAMMAPHHHDEHEHNEHEHHEHGRGQEGGALSNNHKEQHDMNMWKGLVAMMGLVIFFATEKALTMLAEWRKHRQRRNKLPTRVRVMRESDGPNSNVVGEKLCKHKYSSYPYCYGEIANETQDNHHNRQIGHHERPPVIEEEKPLTSNCNSVTKIVTSDTEKKSKEDWRLDEPIVNNAKKNADGADLNEPESYTVILREHETKHHGHSHSHGHVHSAPESMSSVAWMVVMGDGLHNFTDGMAIGAAFSANIAGGFSTAIAVFCHELPHELGDFAVLLKAGMSAKQAVFYNLLSSVLCLFGMIFGVLLGSAPAATSWIFAAAAGIFIYIALVDMIPELSSSHSAERDSRWQCILQGLGLSMGLGIMLLIALYEHDLKQIFND